MSEIIIDGCNVAECEFYDKCNYTTCMIGIQDYINCDKNPNCYYKQLKRLEAENEKLKKEVETWSYQTEKRAEIGEVWYDTAQKYKQALEDIREVLCYGRTFYDGYFNSDKLSRTDEAIKRVNEVLNESH